MAERIAIARRQQVYAVLEDEKGTLKFPTDFSAEGIRPAGSITVNQKPSFSDSEEIADTLDVLDQFQSAMQPADFSVPMYLRPNGTLGLLPQGHAVFVSAMGSVNPATTAALNGALTIDGTSLAFDTLVGGKLPQCGIIQIGTEQIYYSGLTIASKNAVAGTLNNLVRGYRGTTAAVHSDDAAITLKSVYYKQTTVSPSFSLWVKTDHFLQAVSGCTATQMQLAVNNEGAVTVNFSGQGMKMVFAGNDEIDTGNTTGNATVTVKNPKRFSVGAVIYNKTADDHAANGYTIISIDKSTGVIGLSPNLVADWTADDEIEGYLPTSDPIGTPVEGRHSKIYIDNIEGKFKNTDLTFDLPKQFITDEVGTEYPEDYVEDKRKISSSMNVYFRQDSARFFTEGWEGTESTVKVSYGGVDGSGNALSSIVDVFLQRIRKETPSISVNGAVLELQMPISALGRYGEDSGDLVFNL